MLEYPDEGRPELPGDRLGNLRGERVVLAGMAYRDSCYEPFGDATQRRLDEIRYFGSGGAYEASITAARLALVRAEISFALASADQLRTVAY